MATKTQGLAVAKQYGFVLDESVSGLPLPYTVTLDHIMSIGGDCRSITVCDYGNALESASSCAWGEAIERMHDEARLLEPCPDPANCDYHGEGE